jgi:uncharacterized protein
MKMLDLLAGALLIVGGLNLGLVAVAEFDLVAWIFGEEFGTTNAASRIVYGIVGLAAVYAIASILSRRSSDAHQPATSH